MILYFVYSPGTPCSFFLGGQATIGTHLCDGSRKHGVPHILHFFRGVPRRDRHTSRGRWLGAVQGGEEGRLARNFPGHSNDWPSWQVIHCTSPNKASNIESMIFRTSRFFLGYDMDMYGFHMFQGTGTRINRHFLLIRSTQVLCEASAALVKKRGIKLPPGPDVGCYQNAAGDPAISGRLWRPWKVSLKWQERLDYRIIS